MTLTSGYWWRSLINHLSPERLVHQAKICNSASGPLIYELHDAASAALPLHAGQRDLFLRYGLRPLNVLKDPCVQKLLMHIFTVWLSQLWMLAEAGSAVGQRISNPLQQIPLTAEKEGSYPGLCKQLAELLPSAVSFPGDLRYDLKQSSYWSTTQSDLEPTCRVAPRYTREVSQAVRLLHDHDARFAVVGGGHSVLVGASNIESGVTLDLFKLSEIAISGDMAVTEIGAGARWSEVYKTLEPLNLTVAGGRAGSVGVSGFLLGGGISAVVAKYGWSCDSVIGVEAVLANGTFVQANQTHHVDLLRAMKGAGNKFAIATGFTTNNLPCDHLDVGFIRYEHQDIEGLLQPLSTVTWHGYQDPGMSAEVSITLSEDSHKMLAIVEVAHLGTLDRSPSLRPFLEVRYQSRDSLRTSPSGLASIIDESNPRGYRAQRATLTIRNDVLTMMEIASSFEAASSHSYLYRDGFYRPGMLMQPISESQMSDAAASGNALGLNKELAPLLLISFEIRWSESYRDSIYNDLVHNLLKSSQAIATQHGTLHDFVYANYAAQGQPVHRILDRKGMLEPLKETLTAYDPDGFLQRRLQQPFPLQNCSSHTI